MSLGIHRVWKKKMIDWMNPQKGDYLIDMASGTGDIPKAFLERTGFLGKVACVEPNKLMMSEGKKKLKNFENMAGSSQMDLVSSVFEVNGIIYFSTVANDNPFAFYSYNPASSEIQDLTSALTPDFPILLSQLGELPPIGELTDFAVHGTTVYFARYGDSGINWHL